VHGGGTAALRAHRSYLAKSHCIIVLPRSARREGFRPSARAIFTRFFDGLELLEPGLVPVQRWRPGSEIEARSHSAMWGGVGRKP